MKVTDGYLTEDNSNRVEYKATPNFGGKKKALKVLVIHFDGSNGMSGLNWLLDKASKVSSELWLSREGRVVQMANFLTTCWHAGKSVWRDLVGINSYGIGIEIQNNGGQAYTTIQMEKLAEITKALVNEYNLEIVGHEDIAPLRKVDPSGTKLTLFDWKRLFDDVGIPTRELITTADLNIRRGQGTDFPIVTKLTKGTAVYELNKVDNWSKIQQKGTMQSGWVHNGYLTTQVDDI